MTISFGERDAHDECPGEFAIHQTRLKHAHVDGGASQTDDFRRVFGAAAVEERQAVAEAGAENMEQVVGFGIAEGGVVGFWRRGEIEARGHGGLFNGGEAVRRRGVTPGMSEAPSLTSRGGRGDSGEDRNGRRPMR